MILSKNPKSGYWTSFEGESDLELVNVHDPELCEGRGCAIHDHPTYHPLWDAPLNWRTDANKLERICEHGVGHDDPDSVQYLKILALRTGRDPRYVGVHGCCAEQCCADDKTPEATPQRG